MQQIKLVHYLKNMRLHVNIKNSIDIAGLSFTIFCIFLYLIINKYSRGNIWETPDI